MQMGSLKHEDSVFKFPKPLCTPERERKQNRIPLRIAMRKRGERVRHDIARTRTSESPDYLSMPESGSCPNPTWTDVTVAFAGYSIRSSIWVVLV